MATTDCPSGKVRWPSAGWAERFAYERGRRQRRRAYLCPECGGWHLTSREFAHGEWMTQHLIDNGQLTVGNGGGE